MNKCKTEKMIESEVEKQEVDKLDVEIANDEDCK